MALPEGLVRQADEDARSLYCVRLSRLDDWLASVEPVWKSWVMGQMGEDPKPKNFLLPGFTEISAAIAVLPDEPNLWDFASLPSFLPTGHWRAEGLDDEMIDAAVLGWVLGYYRFDAYKTQKKADARAVLELPNGTTSDSLAVAEGVVLARNLINTPTSHLGPAELGQLVSQVASHHGARFTEIVGHDLIEQNFPAVHAVGRASVNAPRLLDLHWGRLDDPSLTLVGKGVCFDTGGLDLKPSAAMLIMKKDMSGAAVMLGLAHAIMTANLPVALRLIIPAVENSVSGNAFRPGDVLSTRKGLSVEIGNTDAEGRLVLADALALACEDDPDLLIDAASLTGAARVAVGPDLPAMMSNDAHLAHDLLQAAEDAHDPMAMLPLHADYRRMIDSDIADINNAGTGGGMAGAITAGLFLKEFVSCESWAHLDIYGWNPNARAGRPKGGEASALRALFAFLAARYGENA